MLIIISFIYCPRKIESEAAGCNCYKKLIKYNREDVSFYFRYVLMPETISAL